MSAAGGVNVKSAVGGHGPQGQRTQGGAQAHIDESASSSGVTQGALELALQRRVLSAPHKVAHLGEGEGEGEGKRERGGGA